MDLESLKRRISVAAGRELADLVIRNGQIVDVFNGEIMTGDIAIVDGFFAGIGEYEGKEIIDASGKFISPSFIDGHVHIESAMITPHQFARVLLVHGVTTIVADPHEIANVSGVSGIRYMLDTSEYLPFDVYFMLPSSVPSTPFEHSGSRLEMEKLSPFLSHSRVLGLAEVMDYSSVINAEQEMMTKIITTINHSGKVDGHAAGLDTRAINVYTSALIRSDHEAVSEEEAIVRLSRGMYLMIREGTVAKDLTALISIVNNQNSRRCLFVTDDKHIDDLLDEGSIDYNVRLSIKHGISPITAIQMATINASECFGLREIGAIAPGYKADFLLLNNLDRIEIDQVYKNGKLVVESGRVLEEAFISSLNHLEKISITKNYSDLWNSLHLPKLKKEDFKIEITSNKAHIIQIVPNSLVTNHLIEDVDTRNREFIPSIERDQLKLAVIERHHCTGHIGLGIVKGLGLKSGAVASSVAHDSHNLIIAGCNDEDMLLAVEELNKIQGGLIVIDRGRVLSRLPLPIAGLLSELDAVTLNKELKVLNEALQYIGASEQFNPFLMLSFLALPVIPHLKLTDKGLFDVDQFKHIPVSINYESNK